MVRIGADRSTGFQALHGQKSGGSLNRSEHNVQQAIHHLTKQEGE